VHNLLSIRTEADTVTGSHIGVLNYELVTVKTPAKVVGAEFERFHLFM